MLLLTIIIIIGLGLAALFTYLSSSLVLIPVWIITGVLSSALLMALIVLIFIGFCPYCNAKSKLMKKWLNTIVKFFHLMVGVDIKVIGRENTPNDTFVVFGNHKSNLDVSILYQSFKKPISAVAKKSLAQIPLCKRIMRGIDVVPLDRDNDREGVRNLLKAIDNVKNGLNYIIFPEGGVKTRETEKMVALRAGAYKLATKPKATILPVSIINSSKISKKKWYQRVKITVVMHKAIPFEEYKDYSTQELGMLVGTIVNEGLDTKVPNTKALNEITLVDFTGGNNEE